MGLDVKGAIRFQFYQVRFKHRIAVSGGSYRDVSILSSTI